MPPDLPDTSSEPEAQSTDAPSLVQLRLELSPDRMEARLAGRAAAGVDRREIQLGITALLKEHEVKHGISTQDIREAVELLNQGIEVDDKVIARGTPSEPGQDGAIEVLVPLKTEHQPTAKADGAGKLDFRDRGTIPIVEPDTPVARLTPAMPGHPGRDVQSNFLHVPEVRMLKLRKGKGVTLSGDGLTLISTVHGMAHRPEVDLFEVQEIYIIDGDVDFQVGHVDFPGVVRVSGSVLPDFKVRCHTLEVGILESRSKVEVKADLIVEGGILGAEVKAGGKVSARYISQSKVTAGDDVIVANEIVASEVEATGRVHITSSDGRIVDSQISAVRGISCAKVNSSTASSILRFGVSPELEQRIASTRRAIHTLTQERLQLIQFLIAQQDELDGTEQELRTILSQVNDPARAIDRDNYLAQIQMIKPLRQALKDGVTSGQTRKEDITYELQRLHEKLTELENMIPPGKIWIDVRSMAEAGTELHGPRASVVLEINSKAFSAREVVGQDQQTGVATYAVKLGPLRTDAK
jgi:hypothetical protein